MSATFLRARRRAIPRETFQPVPLVRVLLSLLSSRKAAPPSDPDWERKEPMSGLS